MSMPAWIDDHHLDRDWLFGRLAQRRGPPAASSPSSGSSSTATTARSNSCQPVEVAVRDISNQGRLGATPRGGGTLLLTLKSAGSENHRDGDEEEEELVLKQIPAGRAALSRRLGLAREAYFFEHLAPMLSESSSSSSLPRIDYAYGNFETGEKCLIMESLRSNWVDSGIFFGPGNPNNWKRNLPELLAAAYGGDGNQRQIPTAAVVAKATFRAIAQIHAAFWKKNVLLSESNHWLRGHSWLQGNGRDSWEASQSVIQSIWKDYTKNEMTTSNDDDDDDDKMQWNSTVRSTVEKAVEGISWQAQLDRLHVDGRWTLVHGDFWPGNIMWNVADGSLRLLDWEMVGLGSGPQDLGQYILSNMDPAERRACESDLLQMYYQELMSCGVDEDKNQSLWEYVWREYRIGGVERWLWFLIYFVGQRGMTDWAQFFHDQIASFMQDHALTPADIVQPRP